MPYRTRDFIRGRMFAVGLEATESLQCWQIWTELALLARCLN